MRRPDAEARAAAERSGRRAELLAACLLTLKGFRILARRFRASGGEIDLVAKRGRLLVLVEVKARRSLDEAVFAVTPRARRRIARAGRAFVARAPGLADCAVRYDIVAVAGLRLRHLADAWRE
ncbi:YraN family protein [Amphiplicatus metriothermophilus]|uniref:UPF0102 protein SAMN06297382_0466 n=1 Tax=Amphiplicatus metriothermophilus TaxID=1519374 RepID=A0A239PJI6_9PROT|nr:YraN family protein [Amphiplicatus metriothermophilus]MBB5517695.1 putative endonuclease [Amphiplicatus metriothermophilus]SNT67971.1 putative endonuclease [Amphiplicatus metriothermophilus]